MWHGYMPYGHAGIVDLAETVAQHIRERRCIVAA